MRKAGHLQELSSTQEMYRARSLKMLRRPLFLTRAGMVIERLTRSFWPLWSWLFAFWSAFAFGLLDVLSLELAYFAAVTGLLGAVAFLVAGIWRFRWPSLSEAADRLDHSIPGRPLTALWDRQAIGADDAASTAVWRAHVEAMSTRAQGAGPVRPDLKISDRDPFGFRYVSATAIVMALLFAPQDRGRDANDLLAGQPAAALASGPIFEGWLEPPRYTGLPTVYLNDIAEDEPLTAPAGSRITLRLYGETGRLHVEENVSGARSAPDESASSERDFLVLQSGRVSVVDQSGERTNWQVTMQPDEPPRIAITAPIERTPKGEMKLSFEAADDYGIVGGTVTIRLDMSQVDRRYGLAADPEPRPEITLDLPLPFRGDLRSFSDTLIDDLSRHPWAGLPVVLEAQVSDEAEQSARAEPEALPLPGRRFFDPLASAIVEQRRDLLWNRMNAKRVTQVLRAVSNLPEDIFESESAYLILRSAIRRVEYNPRDRLSDEDVAEVADLLWQTALLIEDGNLSDAEKRLRRAQERLSEAIKNGATPEELAELMDELRRAMQDYMEKLAQEAERNPDQNQAQNGEMREITSDQLQQMLDRIQELFEQGRTQEAQQLLDQFRQMMENMQTARRQPGQGQGQGEQAMRELQDTLRQQQDLSDESFRRMQQDFNSDRGNNSGTPGQGQVDNGDPNMPTPNAQELARRQEALRDLLERQRNSLPEANSEAGREARDALRRAERQMGQARDSLENGDLPQALDEQADALEALREGIEGLGQETAQNQSQESGRQGDQAGSPGENERRDPLGRQSGTLGRLESDANILPGDDPILRSRELLEEIRRRSGERERPKLELDYLERLLDRF